MNNDAIKVLIYGSALFFGGGFFFWKNIHHWRYASNTPTSKIRSAAQGYVELKGKLVLAKGQAPLVSPLSHTACLWWHYEVLKENAVLDEGYSTDWLCLDDGTGQCWIDPRDAEVNEHQQRDWETAIIPSKKYTPEGKTLPAGKYSYSEKLLLPGRKLYVLGQFNSQDGTHIISCPRNNSPFILSGKSEFGFIKSSRRGIILSALSCLVGIIFIMMALIKLIR